MVEIDLVVDATEPLEVDRVISADRDDDKIQTETIPSGIFWLYGGMVAAKLVNSQATDSV